MKRWRAWVRWIAILVYLLAIPLCVVIAVSAITITDEGSPLPYSRLIAPGAFAMALLLSWRLWLNLRVSLSVGAVKGPLWILLLLGLLALCGLALAVTGVAYIGFSFWLMFSGVLPEAIDPPLTLSMRIATLAITTAMGLLAVAVGLLMAWPLVRRMRRKSA